MWKMTPRSNAIRAVCHQLHAMHDHCTVTVRHLDLGLQRSEYGARTHSACNTMHLEAQKRAGVQGRVVGHLISVKSSSSQRLLNTASDLHSLIILTLVDSQFLSRNTSFLSSSLTLLDFSQSYDCKVSEIICKKHTKSMRRQY